eukprot:CAMPEP_0183474186 /NCGR_PEP_ID=MMETSP0370-20130417/162696_1 /TAXON_ID=268820 /ORGANISM="Peridinium aciculiferum, Strain PAER-2" /LENGTH=68 /DNA_ID=CAMNT_0025666905 /DNA_START=111 /DNA_END=317 /DNA_ORIENTATION=-
MPLKRLGTHPWKADPKASVLTIETCNRTSAIQLTGIQGNGYFKMPVDEDAYLSIRDVGRDVCRGLCTQ